MRLRTLLIAHVAILHAAVAALAWLSLRTTPWALLACEAALALSAAVTWALVSRLFVPLQMLRVGTELLREGDFTARLRPTGQPELDALADVYNRMADQLRAERTRLVEQDLFLERLIDASPAGVVTLDLDDRVSLVSPSAERLLGVDARVVAGARVAELGDAGPSLDAIPAGGSRLVTRAGRSLRVRRAEFRDRGFRRAFLLVEEMTDELRASERGAHERIVQVMAHEVRNSVGAVRSLLDSVGPLVAQLPAAPRGDVEAALDIAARRLLGLNSFMNAVADVVRLPPPRREACDVSRLVDDVVTLIAPDAEARGIALRREIARVPEASLDKNQLEQALINVLRNALEATPAGGAVTVSLSADGELSVRDGGPGLSAEIRRRMEMPFFTTKPGGRGVGLMLVREVLAAHGLPFLLESHPEGGAEARIGLKMGTFVISRGEK